MVSSVTPYVDMDPSPRVDVFIDDADLDPSTVTVSVHQMSVAGDVVVRGMDHVLSTGGFAGTDYEVPFGVPVTYKVQQHDVDGIDLGYVLELVTQVDVGEGVAVLSDPLSPGVAVMVNALADFGGKLTRNRKARVYRAGTRTVALMGLRSLLEDVPLHCETESIDDADALETLLDAAGMLVRVPPNTRLPLVMYAVVPEPEQVPIDVQFGGELVEWNLTGDEVSRPSLDILVAVINYGRFAAYMNTLPDNSYGNAATIWSSYLDAMRNPPPEV